MLGVAGGRGARPSPTAFRSQSFRPLLVPASRGRRPVPTQAGGPAACSEPVLPPGPSGPWRLIRMRTDTLLSTAMAGTRRHTRSGTPREAMSACFLFTSIWNNCCTTAKQHKEPLVPAHPKDHFKKRNGPPSRALSRARQRQAAASRLAGPPRPGPVSLPGPPTLPVRPLRLRPPHPGPVRSARPTSVPQAGTAAPGTAHTACPRSRSLT